MKSLVFVACVYYRSNAMSEHFHICLMFLKIFLKLRFFTPSLFRNHSISKFMIEVFVRRSRVLIHFIEELIPVRHQILNSGIYPRL